MGKKKLTAKARKDKYYQLAKETGYRARSAFKLLQLNKKYGFLQSSNTLVDLCAAPGGWLQVAAEHMPMQSVIIGVDLVAIRPIPRCVTIQDDITTDRCRMQLRKELHQWKVDTFLHDGAPNVGKNWLHDAYSQSVLTLHALKLACDFLKKGGWFVTKVFRSKDYQALMWVLQQLFGKVYATKPQASRNVSAEIFVVCQNFKAPQKIDRKFFDPKSVFQEVEEKPQDASIMDFAPAKKKKKAVGYDTETGVIYKEKTVEEFLSSENPMLFLTQLSQIKFASEEEKKTLPFLDDDIIESFKDIKSCGKREIRAIVSWRTKVLKERAPEEEEKEEEEEELDSDEEMEKKLQEIQEEEAKQLKKKKKVVTKERGKLRERMKNMTQPSGVEEDEELFALDKIKTAEGLQGVETMDMDDEGAKSDDEAAKDDDEDDDGPGDYYEFTDDDEEEAEEEEEEAPAKKKKKKERETVEPAVIPTEADEKEENPLLIPDASTLIKADWFSQKILNGIEDDETAELAHAEKYYTQKKAEIKKSIEKKENLKKQEKLSKEEQMKAKMAQFDDDSSSDDDSDYDDEANPVTKETPAQKREFDAEFLAIGTAIATSKKAKRDLIDNSYNRYTFNDEDLPDWFVQDEKRRTEPTQHLKEHMSKKMVEFYQSWNIPINSRSIKKVVEAKFRKRYHKIKKMEQARKTAEGITNSDDITAQEKVARIKQVYKKAGLGKKEKENTTYVFARKGVGRRVKRPPGVTGKFKVVDKRMKKDLNAQKKAAGKGGKGGGGKGKKGGRR